MIKDLVLKNNNNITIQVSDNGHVYLNGKEKRPRTVGDGYKVVTINGKTYSIHRLVASAFIQPLDFKDRSIQVHHIDENKSNNNLSNLKVMTLEEHCKLHQQIYPLTKFCEICGKEYTPNPTKRKRAKTCSPECALKLKKIKAANKRRPINQYDLNGVLIKVWESGTKIREETGYFDSNINKCCNGHIHSYKGYIWKYAD